jgi:hypothetical protein
LEILRLTFAALKTPVFWVFGGCVKSYDFWIAT